MNAAAKIRELVRADLADNHKVEPVRFMDELLGLVVEVGEISCGLANAGVLRFQIPNEPDCDVELGRAKSKLRILCARLAVLCHDSGDPDVSIYGGEGIIAASALSHAPRPLQPVASGAEPGEHATASVSQRRPFQGRPFGWSVCFKNTPDQQRFTIVSTNE